MKREFKHNHENMRRRKRQQRRSNRGAPHPALYTECSPINETPALTLSKGKP